MDEEGVEKIAPMPGLETVVYSVENTPVIETVSSTYLDVEGGETLVITGTGLDAG
jgi:hypothetical protein